MDNALYVLTTAASFRSLSLRKFPSTSAIPLCKDIIHLSLDTIFCTHVGPASFQLDTILRACSQLRTIFLRGGSGIGMSASVLNKFDALILPELEELEIIDNDRAVENYFLHIIRAPVLRYFSFGSRIASDKPGPAALLRNATSIRTLVLCEAPPRSLVTFQHSWP